MADKVSSKPGSTHGSESSVPLVGLEESGLRAINKNAWLSTEDTIMKKLLSTLPLFLLIVGCNQAPMSTDPSAIVAATQAWEAALNAKDVDAIVALYTSDARVLPPGAEMATGSDVVRTVFGGIIDAGIGGELTSIESKVFGDLAYDVGTLTLRVDGEVVATGKFIVTLQRSDDGEWLITNDIWNMDTPPAAPMEEDEPMD